MAKASDADVNLAQSVEEQQAGLDRGMLELSLHEFERRKRADFKEPPPNGAAAEEGAAFVRSEGRRGRFRVQDLRDDRREFLVPASQSRAIAPAKLRKRSGGPLEFRPPFQCASVLRQQQDIELGFDIVSAVPIEFEVGVPRHRRDCAMEEGMCVMEKAWISRIFKRGQSASGGRRAVYR